MRSNFVTLEEKTSLFSTTRILCDEETEIVYIWMRKGYSAGLSVLLKNDGTSYKKNEYLEKI